MASKVIGKVAGIATTGAERGTLVELSKVPGLVNLTATGVAGKRHATTSHSVEQLVELRTLIDQAIGMVSA